MARPDHLAEGAAIDEGLRTYMVRIYIYMVLALLLTGGIAYAAAGSPEFLNAMFVIVNDVPVGLTPLAWIVMLAPVALAVAVGFAVRSINLVTAQFIYWLYAGLIGLSLSVVVLTFTGESVALVFLIAAGTFGAMSLHGYTTRRDLAAPDALLTMALNGLIIAMVVNLFFHSSALMFALSIIGVLVFTGLTAADTQVLKGLYQALDGEEREKAIILGALTLYLDFINLFLNLLNLFGRRRGF